jgi:hypothetical protein
VIRNQNQTLTPGPTATNPGNNTGNTNHIGGLNHGPKPITVNVNVNVGGGPRIGPTVRPAHPTVLLNNAYFPIVRSQYFLYPGGVRKYFVPFAALGAAYIGGSYWDPDGYVSVLRRYCSGTTENGCALHWRMVDFADGGGEQQCVRYCPHAGPPPAKFAELPPPPPVPPANATCQLSIFADPNFGGTSAPTVDAQPNLAETGWQNAISSIQIQSGTWDFFTEPNYGGASMRLRAGPVPTLPPDWDKKIGSFQCVQRGAGAGA